MSEIKDKDTIEYLIKENTRLVQENFELKSIKMRRFNDKDCWIYQGDGEDHLESLVCPVVIRPQDLQLILEHGEYYKKHVVMGFWYDRYPVFSQGFNSSEVLDEATADQINGFVDALVKRDIQIWEIAKQLGLENTFEEDSERDIEFIKNRLQIV
jgi:hypothetical protein